jgi:hypothetical protein
MLEAGQIKVFLIFELRLKARFVDAGGLLQFLKRGSGESFFPKKSDGLVQEVSAVKFFGPAHFGKYRR